MKKKKNIITITISIAIFIIVLFKGCTKTIYDNPDGKFKIKKMQTGFSLVAMPGDGQNDYLVFTNLEFYENHLKIFNRWGTIIYEANNYKNDWDGDNSSEGTYFFLLEIEKDGETETHKGSINILK